MKLRILLPLLTVTGFVYAAETNQSSPAPSAAGAQIQRGKYLVENVALCAECHTPKTDKGDYDRTQWLAGNLLDIKPDHPMPFAAVAPPIAGMPGFTDEQALKFLETGIDLTGKRAMSPMPPYRFNHDDAQAVLAYLRSLRP
jgi:mono/diheme cytochrome c family protein